MGDNTIVTDVEEKKLSRRDEMIQNLLDKGRDESEGEMEGETEEEFEEESNPPEDDLITLKVNGEEVKASRDKVLDAGIRTLQKETAADRRLAEVQSREAELERRRAELDQLEQSLKLKAKDEPDEFGRKFAENLFTNDDAVAKTMTSLKREIDDLKGGVQEVMEKEKSRAQTDMDVAVKHYHSNYLDIASDPEKHEIFNRRLSAIGQTEPSLPIQQAIDKAANGFYEKFGGKPDPEKSSVEKIKETLIKHPKGGSVRQKAPPEQKPKTRAETLNEIRMKRGVSGY